MRSVAGHDCAATRCARGLLAHGIEKGDRVGIWSPNRYKWVVLQFAAAHVGAILVNVNPAYKSANWSTRCASRV